MPGNTKTSIREFLHGTTSATALRVTGGFLSILVITSCIILYQSYHDSRGRAETMVQTSAQVVAVHTQWLIEASRQALSRIESQLGDAPGQRFSARAQREVNNAAANLPESVRIAVFDETGAARLSSMDAKVTSVADRDYFQRLKNGDTWYISPLYFGRTLGKPVFNIGKRLERDGRFIGIATVIIPADLMGTFWQNLDMGEGSTIGLVDTDGWLVVRYPIHDNPINLKDTPLFVHLAQSSSGTYDSHYSPADGRARVVGYHRVDRAPLIALAGMSRDEVFAPFWRLFWTLFFVTAPIAVVFIGTSAHLLRQERAARGQAAQAQASLLRFRRDLQDTEARYSAIVDATPDCVKLLSPEGDVLSMNPAGLRMLEAEKLDDVLGTKAHGVFVGDDRAAFFAFHERVCAGKPGMITYDVIGFKGTRRTLETHAVPLPGPDGRLQHLAITRDITAEQMAQEALSASERRFRSVFNQQFQFMAILNADGIVIDVNELPLKVGGVTRQDVVGEIFWEARWWRGLPHMQAAWPVRLAEAARTSEPVVAIDEYRDADGKVRVADSATTALRDANGNVEIYIIQATDITDRRIAENQLRDSEARFRQLADAMPQIVWTAEADGTVDYFNQRWYEITGIAERKRGDAAWTFVVHPDDVQQTTKAWYDAVAKGADFENEYRLRSAATGGYQWHLARAVPVRDGDGKVIKWYGTTTDIHDLKAAEVRAEAGSRAKSEFLANMSHEIRTPMNAIVGIAGLLEQGGAPPARQKEYLATLRRSAGQLMALINDLLDISKIEAGRLTLEEEPFKLEDVITDVMTLFAPQAAEKNISLVLEENTTCGELKGDPGRLRQVLVNIVGNAVKFTEKGEVRIAAVCTENDDDTVHTAIQITDTGIGIPRDLLETIFSKFEKADSSMTRRKGGTGLGLTISRALVEAMGGTLTVESLQNHGSVFRLEITFGLSQAYAKPAAPPSSKRILLVEDTPANILVATSFLEAFGYACDVAENGREALEKCAATRYDVILMDVQMPEMDGYTATEQLRALEKAEGRVRTRIIGMTAHVRAEDRQRCFDAGMDDYIAKPFRGEDLQAKIEKS